jgi:AcrR family transcriptional regulator
MSEQSLILRSEAMTPRYKKANQQEIREQNRKLLLDAAAQEFARDGYHAANTNRISKSAGFASGTIFNYFPTKKDLMLTLLTETARAHCDFVADAVRQTDNPARRLEVFFEAGFAFIAGNLAPARVMVNTLFGADEEFKQHLFTGYQTMFQLVAEEILASGMEAGVFRPVEPIATANLLMTIYLGTASQLDEGGQFYLPSAQVAEFASHALLQVGV